MVTLFFLLAGLREPAEPDTIRDTRPAIDEEERSGTTSQAK